MDPFYGWSSTTSRLEPLRGGSSLFTTKFPCLYIFQRKTKSNVHSHTLFPYCKLLLWVLTGYCILQNILQNTVALWVSVFCKIFLKISLPFLLTFNRLKCDQRIKICQKEILNITPCFTNGYFSGQYFNYKIILEFLNEYKEAKIP